MKIRNGFVSNSSSSSFIVLLPEDYKLKETRINIVKAFEKLLADKKLWEDFVIDELVD